MNPSKPLLVQSAANPRIRHLVRMRDNRNRRKANRVIVDGWRETERALAAGLVLCQQFVPSATSIDRIQRTDPTLSQTTLITDSLMRKISYGDSARGVVSEFERPERSLDRLYLPPDPLILLLDRLEKPGNVGAVFRSADAVGIHAVLLCESADPFNPNAIRNSLGSVFHVPWASGSVGELSQFLIEHRVTAIAARVESSQPLWDIDFRGSRAIIVGSEADGLSDRWQPSESGSPQRAAPESAALPPVQPPAIPTAIPTEAKQTAGSTGQATPEPSTGIQTPELAQPELQVQSVRIPMAGSGDSLNVSVSVAVICYEAARQRGL